MRVCLIRHFAPDITPGICYGRTDLSLKELVNEQSERLTALRLQLAGMVALQTPVFSSPLRRCAEVAAALSTHFVTDARLQELNFGAWEMQAWNSIGVVALDAWAADLAGFRPPGGETGYELQQRALDWLRETSAEYDQVIAVTHGGVMRALQAHHQCLPGSRWLNFQYEYGELICLDFDTGQIHAAPVQ